MRREAPIHQMDQQMEPTDEARSANTSNGQTAEGAESNHYILFIHMVIHHINK